MMRIIIDGTCQIEPVAGIKRYYESLIKGLASVDDENKYKVIHFNLRTTNTNIYTIKKKNFQFKKIPFPRRVIYKITDNIPLNPAFILGKIDLIHFTNPYIYKVIKKIKTVVTIHDVAFLIHPEFYYNELIEELKAEIGRAMERADGIITISENSKRDIIEYYDFPEKMIKVIPLGVDFIEIDIDETLARTRYNLEEPYFLSVSTLQPRKNFEGLIRAFRITKNEGLPHKLVIAGKFGWMYDGIFEEIERHSLEDDVIITGAISDELLVSLYMGADIFVYPSFYEGFGLPPLEASFYGVPVICSNVSSIPEVMGDSASYIDPSSDEDIAKAMLTLTGDDERKRELRERGYKNLNRFSWEKTAQKTLDFYREVVSW